MPPWRQHLMRRRKPTTRSRPAKPSRPWSIPTDAPLAAAFVLLGIWIPSLKGPDTSGQGLFFRRVSRSSPQPPSKFFSNLKTRRFGLGAGCRLRAKARARAPRQAPRQLAGRGLLGALQAGALVGRARGLSCGAPPPGRGFPGRGLQARASQQGFGDASQPGRPARQGPPRQGPPKQGPPRTLPGRGLPAGALPAKALAGRAGLPAQGPFRGPPGRGLRHGQEVAMFCPKVWGILF